MWKIQTCCRTPKSSIICASEMIEMNYLDRFICSILRTSSLPPGITTPLTSLYNLSIFSPLPPLVNPIPPKIWQQTTVHLIHSAKWTLNVLELIPVRRNPLPYPRRLCKEWYKSTFPQIEIRLTWVKPWYHLIAYSLPLYCRSISFLLPKWNHKTKWPTSNYPPDRLHFQSKPVELQSFLPYEQIYFEWHRLQSVCFQRLYVRAHICRQNKQFWKQYEKNVSLPTSWLPPYILERISELGRQSSVAVPKFTLSVIHMTTKMDQTDLVIKIVHYECESLCQNRETIAYSMDGKSYYSLHLINSPPAPSRICRTPIS